MSSGDRQRQVQLATWSSLCQQVDEIVVEVVRKHFPKQAEVLSDPRCAGMLWKICRGMRASLRSDALLQRLAVCRVELIVEDVLTWMLA